MPSPHLQLVVDRGLCDMPERDSTLREAIFSAAMARWCEIAPIEDLRAAVAKDRARAEATANERTGREIPASSPAAAGA